MIEYIDSNIGYRSANENYKMQKVTGLIGFWSLVIAAVAMVATCMGSETIINFISENYRTIIEGIIGVGVILFLGKILKCVYFKLKK